MHPPLPGTCLGRLLHRIYNFQLILHLCDSRQSPALQNTHSPYLGRGVRI